MRCEACPFNDGLTEAATIAQNYGCLPTGRDNIEHFDRHQKSIGCHDNDRHCRGLLEARPEARKFPIITYPEWYQTPQKT